MWRNCVTGGGLRELKGSGPFSSSLSDHAMVQDESPQIDPATPPASGCHISL